MVKLILLFFVVSLLLCAYITCQSFKCPQISRFNESKIEMADVCACFDKQQRRILCRSKMFDSTSLSLVPEYTDFIRRSLPYDRTHLSDFDLCYNIKYNNKLQTMPLVHIGPNLMSELNFDHVVIAYCGEDHTQPVVLEIDPRFLEMQTSTLIRLVIEIPSGVGNNDSQVLFNIAQAVIPHKRLDKLVIWMDKNLHLHIPDYWFGLHSPFSYVLPLTQILITNHHLKENEHNDQAEGDNNQVLSIGSYAFLHLKRLHLVTLQNVIIDTVAAFAFSAQYPMTHSLTINFTSCNLHRAEFDRRAFHNLNRAAIIYFGYLSTVPKRPFIPSQEVFSEFLLANPENKLQLNYYVDCNNKELHSNFKWMLDAKNRLSTKQIELRCSNKQSIFNYKFKIK